MPSPPRHGGRLAAIESVIGALPSGLTCTEAISGGDVTSLYSNHTIISSIGLAADVGGNAGTSINGEVSAMTTVASGVIGFLAGGMVVAGAYLRYSKKKGGNQQRLLSEPEV